jgi:hypothetical protein
MNGTDTPAGHIVPGTVYIVFATLLLVLLQFPAAAWFRKLFGAVVILLSLAVVLVYAIAIDGWTNSHRAVEAALLPFGVALLAGPGPIWRAGLFASSLFSYIFYITHDHGLLTDDMDMDTPEDKAHAALAILWALAAFFALLSLWPGIAQGKPLRDDKPNDTKTPPYVWATLGAAALAWALAGIWMIIMGACLYGQGTCGGAGEDWTGVYTAFDWLLLFGLCAYFVGVIISTC